jgi:MADS-box transcription factor
MPVPSPPQPEQNHFQSPPLPQPKPLSSAAKHSIFTPIDDSRSMLAAHWGSSSIDPPRSEAIAPVVKMETGIRSQSIDVASMARHQLQNGTSPPQPLPAQKTQPQRTQSTSSVPPMPPSRTNSIATDAKRPRLKVQIPSEHSDAGSATADSSPKESGTTGVTPLRTSTDASHSSSGVLLPPPSPSANSLLSAGASGPPNPFARPPPPTNNNSYSSRSDMETPISALPSRFVENGLLPSPSSFYPEGWFRDSNMLPSPLTFQTPVVPNGPGFGEERKRKTSDEGSDGSSAQKRIKA